MIAYLAEIKTSLTVLLFSLFAVGVLLSAFTRSARTPTAVCLLLGVALLVLPPCGFALVVLVFALFVLVRFRVLTTVLSFAGSFVSLFARWAVLAVALLLIIPAVAVPLVQDEGAMLALPECPCSVVQLLSENADGRWVSPRNACNPGPHPGAAFGYRSRPRTLLGPGQQCCYDAGGQLINAGPGAGTPDVYAFGSDLISSALHGVYDYLPFACVGWTLYNEVWVPSLGRDERGRQCRQNPAPARGRAGARGRPGAGR